MQDPNPLAAQQAHSRQLQPGLELNSTSANKDGAKSRTAWPEKVESLCVAALVVDLSCLEDYGGL